MYSIRFVCGLYIIIRASFFFLLELAFRILFVYAFSKSNLVMLVLFLHQPYRLSAATFYRKRTVAKDKNDTESAKLWTHMGAVIYAYSVVTTIGKPNASSTHELENDGGHLRRRICC